MKLILQLFMEHILNKKITPSGVVFLKSKSSSTFNEKKIILWYDISNMIRQVKK